MTDSPYVKPNYTFGEIDDTTYEKFNKDYSVFVPNVIPYGAHGKYTNAFLDAPIPVL
jgi:hypothetical protein